MEGNMATNPEYSWDDLEKVVGEDFSDGEIHWALEPVEWTSIRRYCEAIESDFPLFHSKQQAQKYGYTGIICPASHVQNHTGTGLWRPGDPTRWPVSERNYTSTGVGQTSQMAVPAPSTTAAFATDREVEYLKPVYIGDHLGSRGRKLLSVNIRETSVGFGAFTVFETEWINQNGEVVGLSRGGSYQYNPHTHDRPTSDTQASSRASEARPPFAAPEARASYTDWTSQKHYEDVSIGDLTIPVTFNLTVQRLVYEAGGNRDFNAIHHNDEIARAGGAPAMYANNGFIQGMWERAYREFFGVEGWIQKVGPFRMRIFNVVGEPTVVRGKATNKWQENNNNFVELEMWSETPKGISVGPGPVIGTLPSKAK
jgi:acyl dehydratase